MKVCSLSSYTASIALCCRLYHTSRISLALTSTICIGGRDALLVPRARLGRPSLAQGTQRPCQLRCSTPFGQGRTQCGKGPHVEDVGSHAGQRCCKYEIRQRCENSKYPTDQSHLAPEGELVRWSTDGSLFVVQTLSDIDVYNTVCSDYLVG